MVLQTPAKINLSLHITGRRTDGYHTLRMVMQTVPWHDTLTIERADRITVGGSAPNIPYDGSNLAYRAADAFFRATGIVGGASIYLDKQIPSGAGLGGGSGNAAGVILALNQLYGGGLTRQQCREIGCTIGADVPFFMEGGTCLAEGIGEQLTPLPQLPAATVVLAKPDFGVNTRWAYQAFDQLSCQRDDPTEQMINALSSGRLELVAKQLHNLLEQAVIPAHPLIEEWKQQMVQDGALGSLMSGSGSTVFGLFDSPQLAQRCAERLRPKAQSVFVGEIGKK